MSRKLVTVRQVIGVDPIEGADAIERITLEGWNVVSQKGNYHVGDLAVYFEIDSFLPDGDARWQDLVTKSGSEFEGNRGHRLRTIKLRGQVSQGFSIPLHKFPEIEAHLTKHFPLDSETKEGWMKRIREHDYSELLGVVKWEAAIPAELNGLVKGPFPYFISKTDQERIQNLPTVLEDSESVYERTMKLDGSSMTTYFLNGEVGVCSRNLELKIDDDNADNTYIRVSSESGLLRALRTLDRNIAVQGELMGPGIQGNREKLREHRFYVFDIFDIDAGKYLAPVERRSLFDVISQFAGGNKLLLNHVPVLDASFTLKTSDINQILAIAEGPSITHQIKEGDVYKRQDGQKSFKVISNKFLLKEKYD